MIPAKKRREGGWGVLITSLPPMTSDNESLSRDGDGGVGKSGTRDKFSKCMTDGSAVRLLFFWYSATFEMLYGKEDW